MPKKKSAPRSALATFVADTTDPRRIVDQLDEEFVLTNSPYHRAYREARAHFLADTDNNIVAVAKLLDEVDVLRIFEDVARRAGFVVGFEYARGLFGAKGGVR